MKYGIIILVLVVVGFGAAALWNNQSDDITGQQSIINQNINSSDDKMTDDDAMMEDDKMENDSMTDDDAMMEDDKMDDSTSGQGGTTPEVQAAGEYRDYDPSLLSRANTGDVVLFFHAGWCPTCKTLNASLNASASDIPSDLTILKVDYDTEKELKQKYAVTYQHTLVQVDAQGNQITKWNGGSDLASITSKLK